MAKLRNIRAYVPGTDDTTGVDPKTYETGTDRSILRKINLNVDIATQDELNQAFTQLSNEISSATTAYVAADQQLSADLKEWAKGEELSGAIHAEITAEADRAYTAEQAISTALTAWNVTVVKDETPETSAYVATYHVEQGGVKVGEYINIPKDYVVKDAALCTVTEADVPYEGAEVGDKYIDFTVNTAGSDDPKHIYLPVKDLVDVYTGGTTDFATVEVDNSNVIRAYVSADLISGAAVDAVVGETTDLSGADTINGVRAYVDAKVAGKNVSATGDTLVSADASDNAVTVGATPDLTSAVEKANSAIQEVTADGTLLTATQTDDSVEVTPTAKLTAAVAAAETALQSIAAGTSHDYVTVNIPAKAEGATTQTVEVSVLTAELTADTAGLAEATDVKQYVDGKITDLSVTASGDDYVTASSNDKTVTVGAADRTKAAIDKVEATSATWDDALQTVTGLTGDYVGISVSTKEANNQSVAAVVNTHEVSSASLAEGDGLAVASDVKSYVDQQISEVDDKFVKGIYSETTAYVNIGGDPELTGNKKIIVNLTNSAIKAINDVANKAYTSALTAEVQARQDNDTFLSGAIDDLSGTYVDKTTYDTAAATLESAVIVSSLNDYEDIDSIIAELEALKAAVKKFAQDTKTA